jgi:hypothetical protein
LTEGSRRLTKDLGQRQEDGCAEWVCRSKRPALRWGGGRACCAGSRYGPKSWFAVDFGELRSRPGVVLMFQVLPLDLWSQQAMQPFTRPSISAYWPAAARDPPASCLPPCFSPSDSRRLNFKLSFHASQLLFCGYGCLALPPSRLQNDWIGNHLVALFCPQLHAMTEGFSIWRPVLHTCNPGCEYLALQKTETGHLSISPHPPQPSSAFIQFWHVAFEVHIPNFVIFKICTCSAIQTRCGDP